MLWPESSWNPVVGSGGVPEPESVPGHMVKGQLLVMTNVQAKELVKNVKINATRERRRVGFAMICRDGEVYGYLYAEEFVDSFAELNFISSKIVILGLVFLEFWMASNTRNSLLWHDQRRYLIDIRML